MHSLHIGAWHESKYVCMYLARKVLVTCQNVWANIFSDDVIRYKNITFRLSRKVMGIKVLHDYHSSDLFYVEKRSIQDDQLMYLKFICEVMLIVFIFYLLNWKN